MGRNWVNYVYRTRWVARLDVLSVDSFCNLFPAIQTALEIIAENIDDKYSRRKVDKAKSLFMSFCPFQTIVNVVMISMVIIHKRPYKEAARYWQRFSQRDEWCKSIGNFKRITKKYRKAWCNIVSRVFNSR